ncbi:MAG: Flp pilus assembly protein CpaB [Eubacteriales bacterium]|nr:Flp pilus assembly protein CpaB [Eubacteriales bacterium]
MKNRTIIGIVCIILAVATMFGVAPLVNKMAAGKVSVVRVNADIAKGTAIKAEYVTVIEIGKAGLQENAVTDTKAVVGKYAVCDIKSGTNVLASYLSDKADSADDIFRTLNGTKQAVSITIDSFAGGVSGKLENGDIVSIIVTREKQTSVPAELTYVRVITTTTAAGVDKNDLKPDEDGNYELPTTVTLLVNKEQAKILANYESDGDMHLSLIFRGDELAANKYLEVQEKVFTKTEGGLS